MDTIVYIIQFLKQQNSVVIARFGRFFLQNTQAILDENTKSILPPAKEVSVEINYLIEDDKKLAKYIAQQAHISQEMAETEIKKLADYWKVQLEHNQEINIGSLGRFIQTETEIQFFGQRIEIETPDYYGLETINLTALSDADYSPSDYQFNKTILWIFLLVVPVLGFLAVVFTQKERLFGKKSFEDYSVKISTEKPKNLPAEKPKDTIKVDSTK